MTQVIELTQNLIARASVTPDDAGCQPLLAELLQPLGFQIEHLRFADVDNLWARRGTQAPLFVFVGHSDVVPTGPLEQWTTPPFQPTIKDGWLYGRGASDMKGSVAAFIVAIENFLRKHSQHHGSIGILITSDEEGPGIHGVKQVMELLQTRAEKIDYCVVGEPTCNEKFGDTIKIGRRGSLSGKLRIFGKQGHIAYPQKADNPIHRAAAALNQLCEEVWDKGNENFQPTSFQISNIHAGTGAGNVIPGELQVQFNFRHSPVTTADELQLRVEKMLQHYHLHYDLQWTIGGLPFITQTGRLRQVAGRVIQEISGITPEYSTTGGTSDARFIAPTGAEVIEFGPRSTAHQINECVNLEDLENLVRVYEQILIQLLCNSDKTK